MHDVPKVDVYEIVRPGSVGLLENDRITIAKFERYVLGRRQHELRQVPAKIYISGMGNDCCHCFYEFLIKVSSAKAFRKDTYISLGEGTYENNTGARKYLISQ